MSPPRKGRPPTIVACLKGILPYTIVKLLIMFYLGSIPRDARCKLPRLVTVLFVIMLRG